MKIEKREHAELIAEALKSHERQNDYFGVDGDEQRAMCEIVAMLLAEWPDLMSGDPADSFREWLRIAPIYGADMSPLEAAALRGRVAAGESTRSAAASLGIGKSVAHQIVSRQGVYS